MLVQLQVAMSLIHLNSVWLERKGDKRRRRGGNILKKIYLVFFLKRANGRGGKWRDLALLIIGVIWRERKRF